MTSWSLGIDFGTSSTVAAVADGAQPRSIDIDGAGVAGMPSATFVESDGTIVVGAAAQERAADAPERYEPAPKRAFHDRVVFLGDGLVDVAALAGAVLARVYAEARKAQGDSDPDVVRVTYPAEWAEPRRLVLADACSRAGLPAPELIPEPVAAAMAMAAATTPIGRHVAVYDWGGGTFAATVLARTAAGFEVAGPPVGRDPLGGEDVDQRIVAYLGELLAPDHGDEWALLLDPTDPGSRRHAYVLRGEIRRAKEALSDASSCQLHVPLIERDIQITRKELEDLISDDVNLTLEGLDVAVREAGLGPADLAGIYLVGGTSRIPLVAHRLQARYGLVPSIEDAATISVAGGAASLGAAPPPPPETEPAVPAAAGSAPPAAPVPPPAPAAASTGAGAAVPAPAAAEPVVATVRVAAGRSFRPRLAMTARSSPGAGGDRCLGQLVVERPGDAPLVVRAHDEPAHGIDTAGLAQAALNVQSARTPGFHEEASGPAAVAGHPDGVERRYTTAEGGAMLEQYLVEGDRALVIRAPEEARAIATSIVLGDPPDDGTFRIRFEIEGPAGWTVTERLRLTPSGMAHSVTAERFLLHPDDDPAAWEQRALDRLFSKPGAKLAARAPIRLLGQLAGDIVTVTWRLDGTPMITKLGIGATVGEALSLSISLPHADQALFPSLAERALLTGGGAGATAAG